MKVTLVQTQLHWENREKNLGHFDTLLRDLRGKTTLVILPEMFTTGFSMQPEKVAEEANGAGLEWMQRKSSELNAVITGSIAVRENGNYYNRLYWVKPDGTFSSYDKRHLFRMAGEDRHYSAGENKLIEQHEEFLI